MSFGHWPSKPGSLMFWEICELLNILEYPFLFKIARIYSCTFYLTPLTNRCTGKEEEGSTFHGALGKTSQKDGELWMRELQYKDHESLEEQGNH